MRIRKPLALGVCVLAVAAITGCAQSRPRRVAAAEPPLISDSTGDTTVVEAPVARPVTFADRHPMFSRPKQYYDNTNGNKFSKTAAATVIGVPSGFVAEIKQIVVGQTPPPR
jgi:hypothetical protein